MRTDAHLLPEEPIPPTAAHAVRRRAFWQLLCGLGMEMLPLILGISFFSLGWIHYNFLGRSARNVITAPWLRSCMWLLDSSGWSVWRSPCV